jgi:hypothetical protein
MRCINNTRKQRYRVSSAAQKYSSTADNTAKETKAKNECKAGDESVKGSNRRERLAKQTGILKRRTIPKLSYARPGQLTGAVLFSNAQE